MDISDSLMCNTEEYLNRFTITKEGRGQPRYTKESSKWVAVDLAVQEFKGQYQHNRVKAE